MYDQSFWDVVTRDCLRWVFEAFVFSSGADGLCRIVSLLEGRCIFVSLVRFGRLFGFQSFGVLEQTRGC